MTEIFFRIWRPERPDAQRGQPAVEQVRRSSKLAPFSRDENSRAKRQSRRRAEDSPPVT